MPHFQAIAETPTYFIIQGVSQCTPGLQKIYYRKTVGHVFMKPVQIEGTTQKFFSQ